MTIIMKMITITLMKFLFVHLKIAMHLTIITNITN